MVNYFPNCQLSVNPPNPFPTVVPGGTTWKSGTSATGGAYQGMPLQVFNALVGGLVGYNAVLAGLTASQAVTITVQRYLDEACTLPVGAAGTATTTANVFDSVSLTAVVPAMWFDVQVANANATQAVIAPGSFGVLVMPNP